MENFVRYGVGEQSFEVMRERDCLYVDKTKFIEDIVKSGGQYYFLGRPRRFGKSLFLSTLKCFFQGRRELFKGLYVDSMDWDWEPYPVLYLDLNIEKYQQYGNLNDVVESSMRKWEEKFDIHPISTNISVRFKEIIEGAFKKTGKRVVILVDEYVKPLVSNLHNNEMFEYYRNELASLYSNFKSSAQYIRLVFLTGVSRFGHLSVFSGLNNIRDISFNDSFSDICGITENELFSYFKIGIKNLAENLNRSETEIKHELKSRYDGYRFSANGKEMYNPFSIVSVMEDRTFGNYWIQSGQASLLVQQLKRFDIDLEALLNIECEIQSLAGLDLEDPNPVALFYQTGYLTIKKYNPDFELVTLGLPNKEVTDGFLKYLLPKYVNIQNTSAGSIIKNFVTDLQNCNTDDLMHRLQSFFADIPYEMEMDNEKNIHNALLILMKLLGVYVATEYRTSNGRIDLFVKTSKYYYIIELKLNKTAQEAIEQINKKNYSLPFTTDGKEIIKIGINFSTKDRTISDWIVE